jgi:hypothetical protein
MSTLSVCNANRSSSGMSCILINMKHDVQAYNYRFHDVMRSMKRSFYVCEF